MKKQVNSSLRQIKNCTNYTPNIVCILSQQPFKLWKAPTYENIFDRSQNKIFSSYQFQPTHGSGIFMNNSIQQPCYELPPQGSYLSQHNLLVEQPEISNQESQHHSSENDLTTENKNIWSYPKAAQQIVLNCYDYFKNEKGRDALKRTAEATKVSRSKISMLVKNGPRSPIRPKNRRILYGKIDNFTKDLIRRTIYEVYDNKVAPTMEMVSEKIKLKTQDTGYEFPYGLTTLRGILKKLGFRHCKTDTRSVIWRVQG